MFGEEVRKLRERVEQLERSVIGLQEDSVLRSEFDEFRDLDIGVWKKFWSVVKFLKLDIHSELLVTKEGEQK